MSTPIFHQGRKGRRDGPSRVAVHGRISFVWSDKQRHRRLPLVINNARLPGLPGRQVPNLMSRFMKGMLTRLNADVWECWGHLVAVAETFVDQHLYQGTCYKVSGWMRVAETAGYARGAQGDFLSDARTTEPGRPRAHMLAGAVAGLQLPHGAAYETARAVVFEEGGDYVFTVKDNHQPGSEQSKRQ